MKKNFMEHNELSREQRAAASGVVNQRLIPKKNNWVCAVRIFFIVSVFFLSTQELKAFSVPWSVGGEKIVEIIDLPKSDEYAIDGKFIDVGIIFAYFSLFDIPILNWNKRWCYFYGDTYWETSREEIEEWLALELPAGMPLPFKDAVLGKLLVAVFLLYVIFETIRYMRKRKKTEAAAALAASQTGSDGTAETLPAQNAESVVPVQDDDEEESEIMRFKAETYISFSQRLTAEELIITNKHLIHPGLGAYIEDERSQPTSVKLSFLEGALNIKSPVVLPWKDILNIRKKWVIGAPSIVITVVRFGEVKLPLTNPFRWNLIYTTMMNTWEKRIEQERGKGV